MKHLHTAVVAGLALAFALSTAARAQTTGGDITTSEIWSGTVTLTGDVVVKNGGHLTINPGTIVRFTPGSNTFPGSHAPNTSKITLEAQMGGIITAIGTETQRVVFTSAGTTKRAGDWVGISFYRSTTDTLNQFKYCVVEYSANGFMLGLNGSGAGDAAVEESSPYIGYCDIGNNSWSGITPGAGCKTVVEYCRIHDCTNGMEVWNGKGGNMMVRNCMFYNMGIGISLLENLTPAMNLSVNNCTFHHIDFERQPAPTRGPGDGIRTYNGVLASLQNNIFNDVLTGVEVAAGTNVLQNNDYNCYAGFMAVAVQNGDTGLHSTTALDPQFTDAADGDFSLAAGSPCLGTGLGGVNKGAWQSSGNNPPPVYGTGVREWLTAFTPVPARFAVEPNPFTGSTRFLLEQPMAHNTIRIYNASGALVKTMPNSLVWDGTDDFQASVQPGIYFGAIAGQPGMVSVTKIK